MNKLLVICGPTATGKTALALKLAKKFNGVVISADSRQVYKYMDIGTGKDTATSGEVAGYDLVNPNEEFSVSQYMRYATNKIEEILSQQKLPILVGGTGLYIKAVVDGIQTAEIMPNKILRENLKNKTPQELFKILKKSDLLKAKSMNNSDRQNPRRLIRSIEIAASIDHNPKEIPKYDTLFICLTAPLDVLKHRIIERVKNRIKAGFEEEISFLKANNYWRGAPGTTLGYREWPDIKKWESEEFKYAKRQITWFKKDKRLNWFDITTDFEDQVAQMVYLWQNAKKN